MRDRFKKNGKKCFPPVSSFVMRGTKAEKGFKDKV